MRYCVHGHFVGVRKLLKWMLRALILIGITLVLLLTGSWMFASQLRGPLIRYAENHYHRQIRVGGPFEAHLISLHPWVVAEQVTISNPPWTPTGITAQIGHLVLTYDLPWLGRHFGLRRVEMGRAVLTLSRDETGRANWQARNPDSGPGPGPPLIRSLAVPDAQVHLDDRRRHLQYDGTVTALEVPDTHGGDAPALHITGAGQLNGRHAQFTLVGDPLAHVARERPYRFEFAQTSSGSRLSVIGSVPHPFDFQMLEASFSADGEDMKDLYFLTGVRLLDTGPYRLSGRFARRGSLFAFTDLRATSGQSDMQGRISISASLSAPSHLEGDLTSNNLRVSDLSARAPARPQFVERKQYLLPDTPFHLTGMRNRDATVRFEARAVEVGRVVLRTVAGQLRMDHDVVSVAPLSALLGDGQVTGELRLDVTRDVAAARVEVKGVDLPLGRAQDGGAGRPPLVSGPLQVRISLEGRGNSMHALASKANGKVTAVLPRGALRSSAAELAGLDVQTLGLKLAGDRADTAIRCGVASFEARAGLLTASRLLIDTEPVLISGEGAIDLESESMDLRFQGRPKRPRLRVRTPLLVHGSLRHPSFSIEMKKPAAQAGGAVALGVLLTPVAAMLAFVDPGLAKDTNCAALLAQATLEGK